MEFSREIYWNVGHGVLIPMYLLVFLSFGIIAYGFYKRIQIYKLGKPLNRIDNISERVKLLLENVFWQIKVLRVRGPGTAHGLFFWSFLLLLIGTTLVFLQADLLNPLFGIKFLKGTFYKIFSITLDFAGLIAIGMLLGLFVRRYFIKPQGLETTKDDYIMHALLFGILISGFLIEGARMAATEMKTAPDMMIYSPVGFIFGKIFFSGNESSTLLAHKLFWWIHFFLVIGFLCSIPFTKFRHILTIPANYLLTDLRSKGSINTIDLEDEEAESFGVSKVADFTWKDIFDKDACIKCKRCQERCPAYNTQKPLSPMKLINDIGEIAFKDSEVNLIEHISPDVIWSCTTCRACQDICPVNNEHVNKILEMRRHLVLMEGEFPGEEVMTAVDNIEVNGNPFGMAYASRGDWAQEKEVIIMNEYGSQTDKTLDILYFVGCYASFDRRNIEIAKNFITICNAANIRVGILGKEEKCCGDPVRKMGNEYLYQMMAAENIELFNSYGIKHIVTSCPHCFNTLNKDYRDLGLDKDIKVDHYTVFLNQLLKQGKLPIDQVAFNCTYHDSCYIARYNDIIDSPRNLLDTAGATIHEMTNSGYSGFCCGAGGGRILAEEKLGDKISVKRVNMALETGAPIIVSNCPFCLTMFEDGIKMAESEDRIEVKDLSEILVERLRYNWTSNQ